MSREPVEKRGHRSGRIGPLRVWDAYWSYCTVPCQILCADETSEVFPDLDPSLVYWLCWSEEPVKKEGVRILEIVLGPENCLGNVLIVADEYYTVADEMEELVYLALDVDVDSLTEQYKVRVWVWWEVAEKNPY